jgi:ATP-dependent DNA helicase PIF1
MLNAMMIERFSGEENVYHNFDTVVDDPWNHFPIDFLNSITPNGLHPHELKLKINCPVILLRNLDSYNGLCNGTRLIVRALQDNAIDAEIVGGQHVQKKGFYTKAPIVSLR